MDFEEYRVWPDGTVQMVGDGSPFSWKSDDFQVVSASSEEDAVLKASLVGGA